MSPEFSRNNETGLTESKIVAASREHYLALNKNPDEISFAYPHTVKDNTVLVVMKLDQAIGFCAHHMAKQELNFIIDLLDHLHQAAEKLEQLKPELFESGKRLGEQFAPTKK